MLLFTVQTDCILHAFLLMYFILWRQLCRCYTYSVCLKIDYNKGQICVTTVSDHFAAVSNGPCFGK